MANELSIRYPTGSTLYAHLVDATGDVWSGAAFETPQDANWGNYDLAMSEAGTTGYYRVSMPGAGAGSYSFLVYLQAGGAPATTDTAIGEGFIQWDGSAEVPTSTILSDTNELQTDWTDGGRLDLLIDAIKAQTDLIVASGSTLTAAQVWSYITRTLTQTAASILSAIEGDMVSVYQYTTWTIALTGLGDISARSKLYFTVKGNYDDADDEDATILQVEETAGLLYIGGADAADPLMATLTVDNETTGAITVVVDDSVTGLANQHGAYDVKMITASGTTEVLTISTFQIKSVVTKAIT